jgi:hypothetical protein
LGKKEKEEKSEDEDGVEKGTRSTKRPKSTSEFAVELKAKRAKGIDTPHILADMSQKDPAISYATLPDLRPTSSVLYVFTGRAGEHVACRDDGRHAAYRLLSPCEVAACKGYQLGGLHLHLMPDSHIPPALFNLPALPVIAAMVVMCAEVIAAKEKGGGS